MKEGRKPEYSEKTPDNELQKTPPVLFVVVIVVASVVVFLDRVVQVICLVGYSRAWNSSRKRGFSRK